LFSIPHKVLAGGCPGDMDYSVWTSAQKLTFFSPLPISHGINLQSWTNPSGTSLNLGAIDWGADMYCNPYPGPSSASSTVTFLPTNYSVTVNTLARQSASGYGSYAWSWYQPNDVTDNPLPSFNWPSLAASCSGWQCNIAGYGDFINYARVGAQGNYDYNDMNGFPPFVENNLGYSVTANLPAISSITFSTDNARQINAEDSIINDIKSSGHIHVKIDTSSIGNSYTAAIPATNCVELSSPWQGTGPDTRKKFVFIRGTSEQYTVKSFLAIVQSIINNGFKTIDPFKTYYDQFSFYLDLHKFDDSNLASVASSSHGFTTSQFDSSVSQQSSCNGKVSHADEYILFSHNLNNTRAFASTVTRGYVYMDPSSANTGPFDLVAIHETGHAFAGLKDEYVQAVNADYESYLSVSWSGPENCSSHPSWDYMASDNHIYGSVTTYGCTVYTSGNIQKELTYWRRPSLNSMMNRQTLTPKFNVISCGYVVAAIKGEALTEENASKHWPAVDMEDPNMPGCSAMNTVKDGISALSPTASVSAVSSRSIAQGANLTISGSNFTAMDNTVEFTNAVTNQTYDVLGLTSSGGTLQFSIPSSIPPGTYTVKAGTFNSDWSNSIPITITSGPSNSPSPNPTGTPDAKALNVAPRSNTTQIPASSQTTNSLITPSPSSAPTPIVSSTPIPTPTTTIKPSPTPTPTYSQTPAPTPTPTSSVTPTPTSKPSSTPAPVSWTGVNFTAAIINAVRLLGWFFNGQ